MFNLRPTSDSDKLGVEPKHLQCEGNLVDHALAGTVTRGKQFEVLNSVVRPVSVDVVDGFLGEQSSPDVLLHHVTMEECLPCRFAVLAGDNVANISISADTMRRVPFREFGLVTHSAEQGSAFGAAKTLLPIDGASGAALNRHKVAALDACNSPLFVGQFLGVARATGRAIQRLALPLTPYLLGNAVFHREAIAALLAGEVFKRNLGGHPTMGALKLILTRLGTILSTAISRTHREGFGTVYARQLDGHGKSPFFGEMDAIPCWFLSQGVR